MCGHVPDFFVLISSGEADISFNTRGEHHRRGDGFYAWYQAVDEEVTGTYSELIGFMSNPILPHTFSVVFLFCFFSLCQQFCRFCV